MIRLLKIELKKVWPNKSFRVLASMYLIALFIICVGVMPFFQYLKNKIQDFDMDGIDPTIIPFYEFPDIWQNITSVAIYFKLLLGFSLIFSITNEFSYRTIRQNVIDGLSKREFIMSKIVMAGFLSIMSAAFLFILGLITGLIYSHEVSFGLIFSDSYFILVFAFQLFAFLVFTLLVGILIKKSIIAMGVLIFWTMAVENILWLRMTYLGEEWIGYVLPVKAINQLIHFPFPKYLFQEVQDYITWHESLAAVGFLLLIYWATIRLVVKRDL
ncbi:MAG: ABC transporter permease [Cytophagia bacterium]|nr:ABC transporter permease [Cytophagia bacterium]